MIISKGLERITPQLIEKTEDYLESQDKLALLAAGSNSHIIIRKKAVNFENQFEAPVAAKFSFANHLQKLKKSKTAGNFPKSGGVRGRFFARLNLYVERIKESIAGCIHQQDIQENWHSSHEILFADTDINLKLYFPYLKFQDETGKRFTNIKPDILNTYSFL